MKEIRSFLDTAKGFEEAFDSCEVGTRSEQRVVDTYGPKLRRKFKQLHELGVLPDDIWEEIPNPPNTNWRERNYWRSGFVLISVVRAFETYDHIFSRETDRK